MMSTMQAIRDTFAKPAKQVSQTLGLREKMSEREASLSTLREYRRKRVSKPLPSQSISMFD